MLLGILTVAGHHGEALVAVPGILIGHPGFGQLEVKVGGDVGRLQRQLYLFRGKLTRIFDDDVGDDGDRRIADHLAGIVGVQLPFGHDAAGFIFVEQVVHIVDGAIFFDDGLQRVGGAEGVPHGVDRVVGKARLGLMHLAIHPAIVAIYILIDEGGDVGAIERGIKHRLVGVAAAFKGEFIEHLRPCLLVLLHNLIEAVAMFIGAQVGHGPLNAGARDRHLHGDGLLPFGKVELGHHIPHPGSGFAIPDVIGQPHLGVAAQFAIDIEGLLHEVFGKFGVEKDRLPLPPLVAGSGPGNGVIADPLEVNVAGVVAVLLQQLVLQIELDFAIFTRRIAVTVKGNPLGGGELGLDAGLYQIGFVIAHLRQLARLVDGDRVGIAAGVWQEGKVIEIPFAGPRDMGAAEAGKLGQMVVVVGRGALAIPVSRVPVIRAWLDHPFRHDGGGIDIAQPIGADQGINILQHLQGIVGAVIVGGGLIVCVAAIKTKQGGHHYGQLMGFEHLLLLNAGYETAASRAACRCWRYGVGFWLVITKRSSPPGWISLWAKVLYWLSGLPLMVTSLT